MPSGTRPVHQVCSLFVTVSCRSPLRSVSYHAIHLSKVLPRTAFSHQISSRARIWQTIGTICRSYVSLRIHGSYETSMNYGEMASCLELKILGPEQQCSCVTTTEPTRMGLASCKVAPCTEYLVLAKKRYYVQYSFHAPCVSYLEVNCHYHNNEFLHPHHYPRILLTTTISSRRTWFVHLYTIWATYCGLCFGCGCCNGRT